MGLCVTDERTVQIEHIFTNKSGAYLSSLCTLMSVIWRMMDTRAKCYMCVPLILELTNMPVCSMHMCVCGFLLAYLFLCLVLGPGSLAILLAQGFLLLVVQKGVMFMVTHNVVLVVLQHLSQEGILHQRRRQKDRNSHEGFKAIIGGEGEKSSGYPLKLQCL